MAKGNKARTTAGKQAKVLTREDAVGKVVLPTFSELRMKGGLVSLKDLPEGMKLHQLHLGKRYEFVTGRDGDTPIITMTKPKTAGPWKSLSLAAAEATGHAMRGSTVLRDERGVVLMRVDYPRAAGTPRVAKPKAEPKARKPKNGSGAHGTGTVKSTPGARCGHEGCDWIGPMSEAAQHAGTHTALDEGLKLVVSAPAQEPEQVEEPERIREAATPAPPMPDADAKRMAKSAAQKARRAAKKGSAS